MRDVPELRDLPGYRLSPATPGQYRIRREPNPQSLSTVEATVEALRALEPDTLGLGDLLAAFHKMVETQLAHAGSRQARRKKQRSDRPRDLPQILWDHPTGLVVAYGEATPHHHGHGAKAAGPVNWVAQRLETGERFSCILQQEPPISATVLRHLRLHPEDFRDAVSPNEFRDRWQQFLSPDDVLIFYHQRTYQLLRPSEVAGRRHLILKSLFGRWHRTFHTLEELLDIAGVALPAAPVANRAHQRLDMAVALVRHLVSQRLIK